MRRPVKDRDALDLVREWLACNRAEIVVVDLAHLPLNWRALLRTALGRESVGYGDTASGALLNAYTSLGYERIGGTLVLSVYAA